LSDGAPAVFQHDGYNPRSVLMSKAAGRQSWKSSSATYHLRADGRAVGGRYDAVLVAELF
jgi:hypothetical protein